jgi:pyridoxine 5-phosphate synthase
MRPLRLGVNIDHIATLREARKTYEPDPIAAAYEVERAGAHQLVMHLREDRRHISDRDYQLALKIVHLPVDLEMAADPRIIEIALKSPPHTCTLVPERRQELTTEGGLDVVGNFQILKKAVAELNGGGIRISLFIDPVEEQIRAAKESGATAVELHTGEYANAKGRLETARQLERVAGAAALASTIGLEVAAGHGLTYQNILPIVNLADVEELNIGHSIISRAVFVGTKQAVGDMLALMRR